MCVYKQRFNAFRLFSLCGCADIEEMDEKKKLAIIVVGYIAMHDDKEKKGVKSKSGHLER